MQHNGHEKVNSKQINNDKEETKYVNTSRKYFLFNNDGVNIVNCL